MSVEKHREAGRIVAEAREAAADLAEAGVRALDVAERVEETIEAEGGSPAFPCNVSVYDVAAHYTPSRDDDLTLEEGDLVKIDIGAHVDGYIGDSAFTVSLGGDDELVEAAEAGLEAGIDAVESGVDTGEVGEAIQAAIESMGCSPIVNLTGHGLERYVQHAEPTIPNTSSGGGRRLEEGMVVAIEPFSTRGNGRVKEGQEGEIYSVTDPERTVRSRGARELMGELEEYRTLPFARRWLPKGGRTTLSLKRMVQEGVVRNYPVLKEVSGEDIAQAEHTVHVTEDGAEVLTA